MDPWRTEVFPADLYNFSQEVEGVPGQGAVQLADCDRLEPVWLADHRQQEQTVYGAPGLSNSATVAHHFRGQLSSLAEDHTEGAVSLLCDRKVVGALGVDETRGATVTAQTVAGSRTEVALGPNVLPSSFGQIPSRGSSAGRKRNGEDEPEQGEGGAEEWLETHGGATEGDGGGAGFLEGGIQSKGDDGGGSAELLELATLEALLMEWGSEDANAAPLDRVLGPFNASSSTGEQQQQQQQDHQVQIPHDLMRRVQAALGTGAMEGVRAEDISLPKDQAVDPSGSLPAPRAPWPELASRLRQSGPSSGPAALIPSLAPARHGTSSSCALDGTQEQGKAAGSGEGKERKEGHLHGVGVGGGMVQGQGRGGQGGRWSLASQGPSRMGPAGRQAGQGSPTEASAAATTYAGLLSSCTASYRMPDAVVVGVVPPSSPVLTLSERAYLQQNLASLIDTGHVGLPGEVSMDARGQAGMGAAGTLPVSHLAQQLVAFARSLSGTHEIGSSVGGAAGFSIAQGRAGGWGKGVGNGEEPKELPRLKRQKSTTPSNAGSMVLSPSPSSLVSPQQSTSSSSSKGEGMVGIPLVSHSATSPAGAKPPIGQGTKLRLPPRSLWRNPGMPAADPKGDMEGQDQSSYVWAAMLQALLDDSQQQLHQQQQQLQQQQQQRQRQRQRHQQQLQQQQIESPSGLEDSLQQLRGSRNQGTVLVPSWHQSRGQALLSPASSPQFSSAPSTPPSSTRTLPSPSVAGSPSSLLSRMSLTSPSSPQATQVQMPLPLQGRQPRGQGRPPLLSSATPPVHHHSYPPPGLPLPSRGLGVLAASISQQLAEQGRQASPGSGQGWMDGGAQAVGAGAEVGQGFTRRAWGRGTDGLGSAEGSGLLSSRGASDSAPMADQLPSVVSFTEEPLWLEALEGLTAITAQELQGVPLVHPSGSQAQWKQQQGATFVTDASPRVAARSAPRTRSYPSLGATQGAAARTPHYQRKDAASSYPFPGAFPERAGEIPSASSDADLIAALAAAAAAAGASAVSPTGSVASAPAGLQQHGATLPLAHSHSVQSELSQADGARLPQRPHRQQQQGHMQHAPHELSPQRKLHSGVHRITRGGHEASRGGGLPRDGVPRAASLPAPMPPSLAAVLPGPRDGQEVPTLKAALRAQGRAQPEPMLSLEAQLAELSPHAVSANSVLQMPNVAEALRKRMERPKGT